MAQKPLSITTVGTSEVVYTFVVDGFVGGADLGNGVSSLNLDPTDAPPLESNVTITDNGDGSFTVDGRTGGDQGDGFVVDGMLESFSANIDPSGYTVTLAGIEVSPSDLPVSTETIGQPPEPTCDDDIQAAQSYATNTLACTQVVSTLSCPSGDRTYQAKNSCESNYLQSLGWTVESTQDPNGNGNGGQNGNGNGDGNGGGNGQNGDNQGDQGVLAGAGVGALVVGAGVAWVLSRRKK